MTKAIATVRNSTPAPSVTREQVRQRCLRFWYQPTDRLAAQDVSDRVADLAVVLRLDHVVALLLAVDLDRRPGGDVLDERGLGVGPALVLGGGLLEGGAVLVGRDRVALHAAALLQQAFGGGRVD